MLLTWAAPRPYVLGYVTQTLQEKAYYQPDLPSTPFPTESWFHPTPLVTIAATNSLTGRSSTLGLVNNAFTRSACFGWK